MSLAELTLPLAPAGADAEAAFAGALAAAARSLHLAAGGDPATAADIALAAQRVAEAIQSGQAWLDLRPADEDGARLLGALRRSPLVAQGGAAPGIAPLVLAGERLYLARYWHYEQALAADLARRNRVVEGVDRAALGAELDRHFRAAPGIAPDWQKVAAATAVLRRLCVISGGPGTGKTSTVVRILAILLTLQPTLKVAIAAPTGKAAARVQESIRLQLANLDLPPHIAAAMPHEPHTLHRLLHLQPGRSSATAGAVQRLPYDVVVVDEASMIDLALAAKLVRGLREDARLILLGDKDQLSSVEAGAVYAGLSGARSLDADWHGQLQRVTGQGLPALAGEPTPLRNAVVWLEHSYRFGADSPLGLLARAINAGERAEVARLLAASAPSVAWTRELPTARTLAEQLLERYAPCIDAVASGAPPAQVFAAFDRFRVLCSTREGGYGSRKLGLLLVEALRRRLGRTGGASAWFAGRPVLVTANDYALRLFNGDVGIALTDERGELMVHFLGSDGLLRRFAPSRIGNVQEAMAVTVHRSQGSEFERVAVVVDPGALRGLSRELLYTAVTRARSAVEVWVDDAALQACVERA